MQETLYRLAFIHLLTRKHEQHVKHVACQRALATASRHACYARAMFDVVTTHGLAVLVEILAEALAAAPWLARTSSQGAITCPLRVMIVSEAGSNDLGLAAMDTTRDEVVDTVTYDDLEHLSATRARMVAYATAVARVVARAGASDLLSEQLPSPALLAIAELITAEDFERERHNVELEERAVVLLRGPQG